MRYASWDEFMAAPATQAILKPIIDFVTAERHAQLAGCRCAAVVKHHGLETQQQRRLPLHHDAAARRQGRPSQKDGDLAR